MQNKDAKKRLMFITGEDFYFLTYNILLLLKELKCNGEPRKFKDYRKLAFLIDFISDKKLLDILERYDKNTIINNDEDKREMANVWSRSIIRLKLLSRLLYALEQRDLIGIEKDDKRKSVTLWYIENEKTNVFFDNNLYENEIKNIKRLKKIVKGLSNLSLDKLQENLFDKKGINTHGLSFN